MLGGAQEPRRVAKEAVLHLITCQEWVVQQGRTAPLPPRSRAAPLEQPPET